MNRNILKSPNINCFISDGTFDGLSRLNFRCRKTHELLMVSLLCRITGALEFI